MNTFRDLLNENLTLWDLAREEAASVPIDSTEWWLLFHQGDSLAGWCTQIIATDTIRPNEIPQLMAFPALDGTGPHATWIESTRLQEPRIFAYVANLEKIRRALLQRVGVS